MSKKEMDIEEMIAEAKAEEEVAREQAKAAKEEKAREDFRNALRKGLNEDLSNKDDSKVTVSLKEYVILKQKEQDLDRIMSAIIDDLGLSYNNEYLRISSGDNIVDAFRVLYPTAYDTIFEAELERAENEGK
ncbi:MAG: hypothetical protein J6M62_07195 [Selenomonadaceae bacterium]|nr:hypothetical protein [Selenomonadaceae bacterium]